MNSEQIRKFFADYQVTLKRVEQLEAAMRIKSDWDTWCAALRERAEFFRTEYAHMNALMRSVMPEFAKEEPALDDDAWNQLQISMMDFYRADTHDLALLMELAKILQKHYGHSNNLAAMTDVDLTLAYTNLEFSRILREPYGTRARDYYRKISVLSRNFGAIKEHSVHQAIVVAYANLVMSCCVLGSVTMEEAFGMWEEMKELQASDALAATRESEPDVGRLLDIFTERFRTDAYALAKSFDRTMEAHTRFVPPELMSRIEQITAEYYEKLDKPEESTADMFQIITSQCDFDCETGRRTADECWKEIHTFFRKTKPKVKQFGEVDVRKIDVISYYMTCLDALISFLVETTMPMEDKKRYFREYQQDIRDFIADYDTRTGHSNTLNNALEELAFFPNAYALFDTAEEKIDYIFRLVVARHCTAFLHSLMVSAFAEAILSAIIDKEPALMVGYHGMTSPEDVQAHRAEILQFAHDAALLHDVEKPSCCTTDEEGVRHFKGHQERSAATAEKILRRLHAETRLITEVTELIKIHDIRFPATVEMATRWAGRWGEKRFLRFAALRRADTLGQAHPEEAEPYYRALLAVFREAKEQDACFTVRQLAITGCDLMGLGLSGPAVGEALRRLLRLVQSGELPNERAALLAAAGQQE